MRTVQINVGIIACLVGMALSLPACAAAGRITVTAGPDGAAAGPVSVKSDGGATCGAVFALTGDGATIAGQADGEGRLWWWNPAMKPGESRSLAVGEGGSAGDASGVELREGSDDTIEVIIDGKPFTAFNYRKSEPKPYLYPVIGPTGAPVTRDFPMKDNELEKQNKRQDHPHHRSIWTAHGDIRTDNLSEPGSNYWHEKSADKRDQQDRQVVRKVTRTCSGPVFGLIEAEIDWVHHSGRREFSETRTYRFFRAGGQRMIDIRNVFHFSDGDVTFADTKEGGILSLRLAVTMDEQGIKDPSPQHGQMTNSAGGVGSKECWGKAAAWCDYVGPVGGKPVGVAVFDAPSNYGHPAHWHIRDYGLYTANPFGLRSFDKNNPDSSHTFKKGEEAAFRYRIVIHPGDAKAARIKEQYGLFAEPPGTKVSGE